MVTIDLKALIARQMRMLAVVAAIAGLAVMLGAKPAHAQYGPTTGTISESLSSSYAGEAVTFTATFTVGNLGAPPFGKVDFYDGFSTIIGSFQLEPQNNGVATFTTSSLSVGTHEITAYYEGFGDIPEGGTSNDVTLTVTQYGPTTGSISANPTYYLGSPITVKVSFSTVNLGPPPFGKVDIYDEFSTIIATAQLEPQDNGALTFSIPGSALQSGDNYLTGYYEGFGDIPAGSTSTDVDVYNPD